MYSNLALKNAPLWETMRQRKALFSFSYEMTARCNNNCRHCYVNLPASDMNAQAAELSISEIDRISTEAVELGAVWCALTGGEPLLRPDFAEIYLLLKRKGLLLTVFSNATLIQESHISLFKKYPPREFEVTVYGITANTYESVTRRPGSYAAFRRGLESLLTNGIPVTLKAMALRANLHEHEAIAEFCREHTKDFYRYDPMLNLRLDGDRGRNEDIKAERLTAEEIVRLEGTDGDRLQSLNEHCDFFLPQNPVHQECSHLFQCNVGTQSFDLSYDGKFRLCSSLTAPETLFDLRKGSLKQAWTEFVPSIREMRSSNPDFHEKCKDCGLINLCFWCPATAYLETGKLDQSVDYFCRIAHERAKLLDAGGKKE